MKYFTSDLNDRFGSDDPDIAAAADAEWEAANERYAQHLQMLEQTLPAHLREFNALLLHNAAVQSLARDKSRLIMVLKKDISPRDLVILTYELEDEPVLVPFTRQPRDWQKPTWFDFDEFGRVQDGERTIYTQSIVFGNGWELRLHFRDVQVTLAEPWIPANGTAALLSSPATRTA